MPKKKRGRPPTPKSEYRGQHVFCRMTKAEAREVAEAATRAKLGKSEWVRDTLLAAARADTPPPPPEP
jgi:hypothetical protein